MAAPDLARCLMEAAAHADLIVSDVLFGSEAVFQVLVATILIGNLDDDETTASNLGSMLGSM